MNMVSCICLERRGVVATVAVGRDSRQPILHQVWNGWMSFCAGATRQNSFVDPGAWKQTSLTLALADAAVVVVLLGAVHKGRPHWEGGRGVPQKQT